MVDRNRVNMRINALSSQLKIKGKGKQSKSKEKKDITFLKGRNNVTRKQKKKTRIDKSKRKFF